MVGDHIDTSRLEIQLSVFKTRRRRVAGEFIGADWATVALAC